MIEILSLAHLDELCSLAESCFPSTSYSPSDYQYYLSFHSCGESDIDASQTNHYYLCIGDTDKNELRGYLLVEVLKFIEGECDIHIYEIGVASSFRKQGIAFNLLTSLFEMFKKKKATVYLEVRRSNLSAINLYKKCNFEQIGIRKYYYENLESAIEFKKELE